MSQGEQGSSYDYNNAACKNVTHKSSIRSHHITAAKNKEKSDIVFIDGLGLRIKRYIQDIFNWERMVDLKEFS